ncbi:MAG: hypothetical protein QM768_04080 [Agriterribacter sp.]
MRLYKTSGGIIVEMSNAFYKTNEDFDALVNRDNLYSYLSSAGKLTTIAAGNAKQLIQSSLLPPVGSQEVWPQA